MTTAKLTSGYEIPLIGLGTWQSKPGEVETAVKTALKEGYRHVDTAHAYDNEEEVGQALEESFKEGVVKREDVFVVTKLWSTMHTREDVVEALKTSLKKLKLRYLDLYLVHWPISFKNGEDNFPKDDKGCLIFDDVPLLETWKGMEDCVKAGLVRSIGLSNYNSIQIQEILNNCLIPPAVLQVEVHAYFQQHKLVNFCKDKGILVTGYSCLGAPSRPWVEKEDKRVLDDPLIKQMAMDHHKTPAQVVVRWLLQRGISAIPKSVNAGRIKENFQVFDFELSAEEMVQMKSIDQGMRVLIPVRKIEGKTVELFSKAAHYPFHVEF